MDQTKYNDIINNSWYLSTNKSDHPLNWPLTLQLMSKQYSFTPNSRDSTLQIIMEETAVSNEADMFYSFAVNDKYFLFAHDLDGTLKIPTTASKIALWIYPPCNSPLNIGDASLLFQNNNGGDADTFRANIADGNVTNWYDISSNMNGATSPVTFTLINNDIDKLFIFQFSSATTNVSCTYTSSFDTNSDFYMYLSPDVDDEMHFIHSFEITGTGIGYPTTVQPTTTEPTTSKPTTTDPTTARPTTSDPTTSKPTTSDPTTSRPTTARPTTSGPTTVHPTTSDPTTTEPTTGQPTSVAPTQNPTILPTFFPTTDTPTTLSPVQTEAVNDQAVDDETTKQPQHNDTSEIICDFEDINALTFGDVTQYQNILNFIIIAFILGCVVNGMLAACMICLYKKRKGNDIQKMISTSNMSDIGGSGENVTYGIEMQMMDLHTNDGMTMSQMNVVNEKQKENENIVSVSDKDSDDDDEMNDQMYDQMETTKGGDIMDANN